MTILWCGGEDVDFPIGSTGYGGDYNASYSRTALFSNTGSFCQSLPFSGTSIQSAWVSQLIGSNSQAATRKGVGISLSGSYEGIYVGSGASDGTKIAIWKYSNSTWSVISTESGNNNITGTKKIDMQISSFGTNATVNVYVNGTLVLTFTGSITTLNMTTGFNCVSISNDNTYFNPSQIIVADEDTRIMSLKTLAPSEAGDSSTNWTGAYTDIGEVTISDADKIYSSTADADFQCNLTGMPTGTYSVKAVKVAARCVDGSGSKGIALGVKSGGTVNVGDTETCAGYWQTKERLMQVNPVTGVAFTPSEIEALQINLRAKAL